MGMDTKLKMLEAALAQISSPENAVNKIQANKKMGETIQEIEAGLTSTNADIEEIKRREKQIVNKIKGLEDQILYQDHLQQVRELTLLRPP